MARIVAGERARIPDELAVFLVAAAFGQSPAAVRAWPADDFMFARQVLGAIR